MSDSTSCPGKTGEGIMSSQEEYFRQRFLKHGDSHLALDWSSRARQYIRFDALTRGLHLENKRVLDIGCGLGHMFEYFKETGRSVQYTGVDIVSEMIGFAKKKHRDGIFICADFLKEFEPVPYDFIFISGLFNVKVKNHSDFFEKTVEKAWGLCGEVFSFNLMTNYVDYEVPHLFYANPLVVFHFCKKLCGRVALYHDYLPYEFTVAMNSQPFSGECYSSKCDTNRRK